MPASKIAGIAASIGNPSVIFRGDNPPYQQLLCCSLLVHATLLLAFRIGASVDIETVPGSELGISIIQRVELFAAEGVPVGSPPSDYRVSRIGTQRTDGIDHLEVTLVKGTDPEKAYNVYDQSLQQLFQTAFIMGPPGFPSASLAIAFDSDSILAARLGNGQQGSTTGGCII